MNLFLKDRPKNRDVSHRKIRVRVEGDVTPRTLAEVREGSALRALSFASFKPPGAPRITVC